MTRRKQRAQIVSNQYFSMVDGRHEYRVCRIGSHVALIGTKRRRTAEIGEFLERERLLTPDSRRWNEVLQIAEAEKVG